MTEPSHPERAIEVTAANPEEALSKGAKALGVGAKGKYTVTKLENQEQYRITILDVNGTFSIRVTPDGNKAMLTQITPASGSGEPVTETAIYRELRKQNIVFGIDEGAILKAVQTCNRTGKTLQGIIIASGKPSVNGRDGLIRLKIEGPARAAGAERSDGSINYRELGLFHNVAKRDLLAVNIPPTRGQPGQDVFGKQAEAIPGKEAKIDTNDGVVYDNTRGEYRAATDGILIFNPGVRLAVVQSLEIPGDIDFTVGNLDINGDIHVKGSVLEGFSIQATGSIVVDGRVEDAQVTAQKNITIASGVIMRPEGTGFLRAGGSVEARFAQNALIEAKQNITITDSAANCALYAGVALTVTRGRGVIVGGSATAGHAVVANRIGSSSSVATVVQVGLNPFISRELERIASEIEKCKSSLGEEVLLELQQEDTTNRNPVPQRSGGLNGSGTLRKLRESYNSMLKQQEELTSALDRDTTCRIEAKQRLYYGTILKMLNQNLKVKDILRSPVFVYNFEQNAIVMVSGTADHSAEA